MSDALQLLIVRHGESLHNRDRSGGFDSPLTELGHEQARRVGAWIAANHNIAALYASTMLRARQTAEIIAPPLNLPIRYNADLREADFDVGATMPHFADPVSAIGGEVIRIEDSQPLYIAFQSRVVNAFREIVRANDSGTILIVTHGGVIATILRSIFGGHQVSVYADNTAALLLQWMNARWYLVFSNRREHLLERGS